MKVVLLRKCQNESALTMRSVSADRSVRTSDGPAAAARAAGRRRSAWVYIRDATPARTFMPMVWDQTNKCMLASEMPKVLRPSPITSAPSSTLI